MWPLAIIGAVVVYFAQLLSSHILVAEHTQNTRSNSNITARFSDYAVAARQAWSDRGNPAKVDILGADISTALGTLNMAWQTPEKWCDSPPSKGCWWGAHIESGQVYIYRLDPAAGQGNTSPLLLGAMGELAAQHGVPDSVGFVSKDHMLVDAEGKQIASTPVPNALPAGALALAVPLVKD
ncbi:hypothetical protein [Chromobacterium violaceum]|uniref:hypothetical protein n=1 Tax=Chromobacterium violaceum TaxID=536 RepID=UPI0005D40F04|nr:hypothetical protein [Chromobacterium violaceum]KJH67533.1 hypothetical protein UF16_09850 [Chromobacterium violaceum]